MDEQFEDIMSRGEIFVSFTKLETNRFEVISCKENTLYKYVAESTYFGVYYHKVASKCFPLNLENVSVVEIRKMAELW